MVKTIVEEIKSRYNCKSVDAGVFAKVVIDGANFHINAYDVEGVGRVATVEMKRLVGFWDMQSVIITPFEVDMPIFYCNKHREKGKYIYRMEMFDTQMNPIEMEKIAAINERYASLPDDPQNERWYDAVKLPGSVVKKVEKKHKSELTELALEHFRAYFEKLQTSPECKRVEKKKKVTVFVNDLCKQSGIAIVEIFIANYGENIATKLCNEVLFGLK